MVDFFLEMNPVFQAAMAGIFTWFCTLLGSATVFLLGK